MGFVSAGVAVRSAPSAWTARRQARPTSRGRRAVVSASGVKEPKTGITFDAEAGGLRCVGAGVREKKVAIVNVSVYAVALYVDADGCRAWRDGGGEVLGGEAGYEKRVVIELARSVDSATFVKALVNAVDPRLREMATNQATSENEEGNFMSVVAEAAEKREEAAMDDLETMKDLLGGAGKDLAKGTRVGLRTGVKGEEGVFISVGQAGAETYLASHELAVALMDVYLDDGCVSPSARDAFRAGIQAL